MPLNISIDDDAPVNSGSSGRVRSDSDGTKYTSAYSSPKQVPASNNSSSLVAISGNPSSSSRFTEKLEEEEEYDDEERPEFDRAESPPSSGRSISEGSGSADDPGLWGELPHDEYPQDWSNARQGLRGDVPPSMRPWAWAEGSTFLPNAAGGMQFVWTHPTSSPSNIAERHGLFERSGRTSPTNMSAAPGSGRGPGSFESRSRPADVAVEIEGGKRFAFPYSLCTTWTDTESLLQKALKTDRGTLDAISKRRFSLHIPNGQIIPELWNSMVYPGFHAILKIEEKDAAETTEESESFSRQVDESLNGEKEGHEPEVSNDAPSTPRGKRSASTSTISSSGSQNNTQALKPLGSPSNSRVFICDPNGVTTEKQYQNDSVGAEERAQLKTSSNGPTRDGDDVVVTRVHIPETKNAARQVLTSKPPDGISQNSLDFRLHRQSTKSLVRRQNKKSSFTSVSSNSSATGVDLKQERDGMRKRTTAFPVEGRRRFQPVTVSDYTSSDSFTGKLKGRDGKGKSHNHDNEDDKHDGGEGRSGIQKLLKPPPDNQNNMLDSPWGTERLLRGKKPKHSTSQNKSIPNVVKPPSEDPGVNQVEDGIPFVLEVLPPVPGLKPPSPPGLKPPSPSVSILDFVAATPSVSILDFVTATPTPSVHMMDTGNAGLEHLDNTIPRQDFSTDKHNYDETTSGRELESEKPRGRSEAQGFGNQSEYYGSFLDHPPESYRHQVQQSHHQPTEQQQGEQYHVYQGRAETAAGEIDSDNYRRTVSPFRGPVRRLDARTAQRSVQFLPDRYNALAQRSNARRGSTYSPSQHWHPPVPDSSPALPIPPSIAAEPSGPPHHTSNNHSKPRSTYDQQELSRRSSSHYAVDRTHDHYERSRRHRHGTRTTPRHHSGSHNNQPSRSNSRRDRDKDEDRDRLYSSHRSKSRNPYQLVHVPSQPPADPTVSQLIQNHQQNHPQNPNATAGAATAVAKFDTNEAFIYWTLAIPDNGDMYRKPPEIDSTAPAGHMALTRFQKLQNVDKDDTFFVSMLLCEGPRIRSEDADILVLQVRLQLLKSRYDDYRLFREINHAYYKSRGWWRRFGFKGVQRIDFATFYYDPKRPRTTAIAPPAYFSYKTLCSISYPAVDLDDTYIGQNQLLRCFRHPTSSLKGRRHWVNHLAKAPGGQPTWLPGKPLDCVYPPPLGYMEYTGQGLFFTEGWLWRRIAMSCTVMVIISFVVAVVWSVLFTVEQGFAIGGYILGASALLVSLVAVLSGLSEQE